jgi:hypothetical protein
MPIHLDDLDPVSEAEGLDSVLIVPCNLCPAVTVAVREKQPFMNLLRSLFSSAPFENYIRNLQSKLKEKGIKSTVFKSNIYHQWFMCMWTSGRRRKLRKYLKKYEAVIVLGCDTATKTVSDEAKSTNCKVIEGMEVTGLMNSKLRLHLPLKICFDDCRVISISKQVRNQSVVALEMKQ